MNYNIYTKFLDICNYLGLGTSYERWVKMYGSHGTNGAITRQTYGIAHCSKCYYMENEEKSKAKLSSKGMSQQHNKSTWERYKDALNGAADKATNQGFQRAKGKMWTYTQNKLGLIVYYNDKQWVLLDGIQTELIEYHLPEEEYCGWNGKQLFMHKPPLWAVLQIIQNWLIGLHKGRQDIVDLKRPAGVSGPPLPAFQLTRLIKVMNIYIGGEVLFHFFRQGAKQESQALKQRPFL